MGLYVLLKFAMNLKLPSKIETQTWEQSETHNQALEPQEAQVRPRPRLQVPLTPKGLSRGPVCAAWAQIAEPRPACWAQVGEGALQGRTS